MSALFKRFHARYGHKWAAAIDGIEGVAVDEWAQVLAGLDGEAIRAGLDAWDADWPPSATEFARCCRAASGGPPEAAEAWRIICRAVGMPGTLQQRYRHPAVLAAARHPDCDVFGWAQLPEQDGLQRFAPVYRRVLAAGGHDWPAERTGLDDRTGKAVTPEERRCSHQAAREALSAMRSMLGLDASGGGAA